jgi:hypothetical protein
VVEALELLRATPTDFAAAIRDGAGAQEWLWKGPSDTAAATLDTVIEIPDWPDWDPLRHRLVFSVLRHRVEIVEESIETTSPSSEGEVRRY